MNEPSGEREDCGEEVVVEFASSAVEIVSEGNIFYKDLKNMCVCCFVMFS